MYLAIRRSHHALLALSFFIVMVLIVFSTLLLVLYPFLCLCQANRSSDILQREVHGMTR